MKCKATLGEATEVVVEFDYTDFVPGRFSGPAESCYEDEGGELEILSVMLGNFDVQSSLSTEDLEVLANQCWDAVELHNEQRMEDAAHDRWESKQLDKEYNYDRGEGYGH